tara:strand:+ start:25467 stop:25721 length:255 start_codon:yes stop_codon:yes gene_type:complete
VDENSILIPILNEDVTILSVVVPRDFANHFDYEAMKMVEEFENHPSGYNMDGNNKLQQARSFLIQNGMQLFFMDEHRERYSPDE